MIYKNMFQAKTMLMTIALGLFAFGFTACSSDDEEGGGDGNNDSEVLKNAEGIIKVTSGIGDWDEAYITKSGYFCVKENTADSEDATAESKFSSLVYMSADKSNIINVIASKGVNLPTQMVTKDGTIYFSFPNDSILELLYDDGEKIDMIDSIAYKKEFLPGYAPEYSEDNFKSILANSAHLLGKYSEEANEVATRGISISSVINFISSIFGTVADESYVEDEELISEIGTNDSGDYTFSEDLEDWYETEVAEKAVNTLTLWTGKATFKVGGSSCTLSGTIWCPSGIFNDYGTYGIICDEDPEKLFLGEAEYEGSGLQTGDDLSFDVDFRGFKPNTTYYYRAYYKFNSEDHGNIIPNYASEYDATFYDTTIKSFTTGDNSLTVDVVMCIDVTGSMSGIINTVKKNAIEFYDLFNKCCTEEGIQLTGLNAQVVAFRDKNVDTKWLEVSDTYNLPEHKDAYNSFVNGLYASGGGDIPESGLEALQTAFQKEDWGQDDGYHRQVVILWTDAPYLIGSYSDITLDELHTQWEDMPSGRRLILFAPYGNGYYNGEDWYNLDGWKNLIHEDDLYNGFGNFEYILKSIIGELTSKGAKTRTLNYVSPDYFFQPNK